jgi:hypothetical protein
MSLLDHFAENAGALIGAAKGKVAPIDPTFD